MKKEYTYHIAINARILTNNLEGIGYYCQAILNIWIESYPQIHFHILVDKKSDLDFKGENYTIHNLNQPISSYITTLKWYFIHLKRWLKNQQHIDLFYSPDGFIPISIKQKSAFTIHDVSAFRFPKFNAVHDRYLYLWLQPKMVKNTNHIFTISKFSEKEINHFLEPKNISTHYNGLRSFISEKNVNISDVHPSLEEGNYYIYYGSFHPRKNIYNIIKSFRDYKNQGGKNKLLLVGRNAWKTSKINDLLKEEEKNTDIIRIPYLDSDDLHALVKHAAALVYTSIYEGFGLPVLESLSLRTQVITSENSSMSEIGGKYVSAINPESIDSHVKCFHMLEKKSLVDISVLEYIKKYDWNKTATEMMEKMIGIIKSDS